ncbi:MAG: IclR family transcriptional regulator [Terriglobales bacterium]
MAKLKEYSVPSIERALSVLECLAQAKRGFSLSEIGRKLRIPKSSAHLILSTLERRGFLQKNAKTGRYCFGLQLVSLSRSALENLDMREEAKPFLRSLMQQSGFTVHMAVLERDEAVIIEKVEAPGLVKLASWIGRRLDVNCTGVGKALLAFLPDDELDYLLKTKEFARHNSRTIISKSALKRDLKLVRQSGYSLDNEEDEPGVCCIGAPVFDESGRAVAAISISGIASQIGTNRVPILARMVRRVAGSISARLGYIAQEVSVEHQEISTGHDPSEK